MDNQYVDGRVYELKAQIDGLKQAVDNLTQTVSMLSNKVNAQQVVKRSEVIKKINESKSVGMDSAVRISLDGKVIAESVIEQTADTIQGREIKGSQRNETN